MFDCIVTTVLNDGTTKTHTLNLVSQIEFEEIEGVGLVEAFAAKITRKQELRLAWLGAKQDGETVPADLKAFAANIQTLDASLKKSPFGEAAHTA